MESLVLVKVGGSRRAVTAQVVGASLCKPKLEISQLFPLEASSFSLDMSLSFSVLLRVIVISKVVLVTIC